MIFQAVFSKPVSFTIFHLFISLLTFHLAKSQSGKPLIYFVYGLCADSYQSTLFNLSKMKIINSTSLDFFTHHKDRNQQPACL